MKKKAIILVSVVSGVVVLAAIGIAVGIAASGGGGSNGKPKKYTV